ncbi:MAG: hypothetical protein H6832_06715 [Planctomycetes bacterium]|nr:hypothetical protein [Planctomycetota bacterium]MCB9918079.1 hypothetical protein [Planctomycetota bacterium]
MDPRRATLLASFVSALSFAGAFATNPRALIAQVHDPAPVRVSIEAYGSQSGTGAGDLSVNIDASAQDSVAILIAGGEEGQFGFLLLGAERASVQGPFDTHFLVQPVAIVPLGRFDVEGTFLRIPVDLIQQAPSIAHLQVLSVPLDVSSASLSAGLSVRFAAGSEQPKLEYDGPESTAILIARDAGGEVPRYQILHQVLAPTSGFTLEESGRQSEGGVTRAYVTLHEDPIAAQVLVTERHLIDFGSSAEAILEIWIRQTVEGVPGPAPFERAARIERDF